MNGDEFVAIRKKLGLSQSKLAKLLGYYNALTISLFERGERGITPRLALLMFALEDGWKPSSERHSIAMRKARIRRGD